MGQKRAVIAGQKKAKPICKAHRSTLPQTPLATGPRPLLPFQDPRDSNPPQQQALQSLLRSSALHQAGPDKQQFERGCTSEGAQGPQHGIVRLRPTDTRRIVQAERTYSNAAMIQTESFVHPGKSPWALKSCVSLCGNSMQRKALERLPSFQHGRSPAPCNPMLGAAFEAGNRRRSRLLQGPSVASAVLVWAGCFWWVCTPTGWQRLYPLCITSGPGAGGERLRQLRQVPATPPATASPAGYVSVCQVFDQKAKQRIHRDSP